MTKNWTLNFVTVFIAVNSFFKGMGYSSDNKLYFVLMVSTFIGAAFTKLTRTKFTIRETIYIVILVLTGILNLLFGHSTVILFTALTIALLKNVDINKCLRTILVWRIVGAITLLVGVMLGIFKQTTIQMWRIDRFVVRRTINGMAPNILQMNLTLIFLLLIYLYREKITIIEYIVMGTLNYILFLYTLSRTGFIIGILTIFFGISIRYSKTIKNILSEIFKVSYLFVGIFSFTSAIIYNSSMNELNKLFNGRLSYMHVLVTQYHVPFFGSSSDRFLGINIDNGYTALLYIGGLVAFCVISYLMIDLSIKLYNGQNIYALMVIGIISIYSLSESFLPNIFVNFSLFFLSWVIYDSGTRKTLHKI